MLYATKVFNYHFLKFCDGALKAYSTYKLHVPILRKWALIL